MTDPYQYRVVADGCIDVFFENHSPQDTFVMGFCKSFTRFSLGGTFHYTGIRFLPTMFSQLFGVDAAALSDRVEPLRDVTKKLAAFIESRFDLYRRKETTKDLLDAFFLRHIAVVNPRFDGRLYGAIDVILRNAGNVSVQTALDTGISPRQLRRLFAFYVGDSAKTFSKIVRFQRVLFARQPSVLLRDADSMMGNGYYDQAHFIKEFKAFYGVTPGEAYGK